MNGKTLKVVEYNLSFGSNDRMIHVFGVFRYKSNNNLYIVYSDVNIQYNIIYYGSSYVKENSILSMECKDRQEEEIIKEYLFKVTSKESLDNFEMISLDNIEGIEIISSNKLEVKPEVLYQMIDLTIPKPKVAEEVVQSTPKKKSSKKFLVFLIFLILIGGGGYVYFSTLTPKDTTGKEIVCIKEYSHAELSATVTEENTYHFNYQDNLQSVDTVMSYQFFGQEEYQDFIQTGTLYRYMPESDVDGGWSKDDAMYLFKVMAKVKVDSSYDEPVQYEDALSYYKNAGYTCNESLKKE